MYKSEISQGLNSLSDKAKQAKDLVANFKGSSESLQEDAVSFETRVVCEFDCVIEALQRRKEQLIAELEREKQRKQQVFKKSSQECTQYLRQTTGLIEYCLEVLQESDQISFLQISGPVLKRVYESDMQWRRKLHDESDDTNRSFRYKIDCSHVRKLAEELNFCKLETPTSPLIVTDECYAENNSVSFSWRSHSSTWVDGYILEIDDGKMGRFREVYRGKETVCTIDGLHFGMSYRARVRCFNECGVSAHSEVVALSTSKVAWFTLNGDDCHSDLILSNQNSTVTSSSFDERVVLGSIGFSKGKHYWEITIDRYDSLPDPAFGIARQDVPRDCMLGKDCKSWALYIDRKRSYFMHNNVHSQGNTGGIGLGSVVGVLINLEKHMLTFFVDGKFLDTFVLQEVGGLFYPAISLNRNVQATIHTGLTPPEVS
ncbi:E3 ubiquitin-protein ligase TRIM9-like isoform X2 [Convolutriloba macropyga]|uniref:E3 ubiquitin-protein ligase TRIM9-like isoform X2 n=1 Tax=Convolutriloba macropyga TaxID=536237 RepID=UPI003F51CFE0